MKAAAITGALVAALAAGAVATPTFAQPYGYGYDNDCRSHDNGTAGAVIGGIAVIGSNLASHHGGRAGGAALGAVAGAALGNSIARSSAQSCGYSGRAYYDNAYRTSYVERRDYDRGYDNRYGSNNYGYSRYNQGAYGYRPYGGDYSRSYSPY
jgi:hypothetical protein